MTMRKEFSFRTRKQHWDSLKNNSTKTLNFLIVGGGITGAGVLRELALRNIQDAVLIEKGDFASGTSSKSSKLIHAGIRYLESSWVMLKKFRLVSAIKNFLFVLNASKERKILGSIAPHLIKPKKIYFVLGKGDKRFLPAVYFGVLFYYIIQFFQGQFFSFPQVYLRKKKIKAVMPEIDANQIKAVLTFWDSETDDARLVIENLQSANQHGGMALNYVELLRYKQEQDHVLAELKNVESNDVIQVKARTLINASGPYVDEVKGRGGDKETALVDRVAGIHLDIYPAVTKASYYITAGDKRLVFVLLRNEDGLEYSRIGTTERPMGSHESSDDPWCSDKEIDYLIDLTRDYFPGAIINLETLSRIDGGIRPLVKQDDVKAHDKSREHKITKVGDVYHVVGVKLTDYRRAAIDVLQRIFNDRKEQFKNPSLSAREPLRTWESKGLYEATMMDSIRYTMVLNWQDYFKNRRGLKPFVIKLPERYEDFKNAINSFSKS